MLAVGALVAHAGDVRKRAEEAIKRAGASIDRGQALYCNPKTDMAVVLREIQKLPNIVFISLGKVGTDDHLKALESRKRLETLDLRGSAVTDKGMKAVASHKRLRLPFTSP